MSINELVNSSIKKFNESPAIRNTTIILVALIIILALADYNILNIVFVLVIIILLVIVINYLTKTTDKIAKIDDKIMTLTSTANYPPDIKPTITPQIAEYDDIKKFIYDIQDYYYVNDNAFVGLLTSLSNFIHIYNQIMFDRMIYCSDNFQIAIDFARNAMNNLQSMIYRLDTDKLVMHKFHASLSNLDSILNKYISEMASKCGVSDLSGPRPFNFYDEQLKNTATRTYANDYPHVNTFTLY